MVTLDEILNDSKVRAWVDTLPEVCLSEATRPYTAEELAAADKLCNVDAAAPAGRKPKLIFQLGAAGTGKSTRMQDCYTEMGVSEDGIVVADGDNVRQSHVGLSAAFNMTKKSLIDAMTAAGSPELGQYTKELESFADEHPVGFKDCGKWAYQGSGPHKNAIADAALAAKKDVVMGITKKSQMTSTYKSVIDGALANGYEISAMATFVVPEELCERQVGRGKKKGRLVQWHKECTDGNIVTNAWLKQQLSINAVDHLSALVREHSGTLMLFDNTPNYFKDPSTKQGAFWTQKGADTTVTYKGEATMAGCLTHIMSIQSKILSPAPAAAAPAPAAQTDPDKVTFRFVRHGETFWNAEKRAQGQTDIELNEKGIKQAAKIAKAVQNYPCDAVMCSSLKRAAATGKAIHEYFASKPFVPVEGLWEAHQGKFQGCVSSDPERQAHSKECEAAYMSNNDKTVGHPKPDGESPADVMVRAFRDLEANAELGHDIFVACHGGVMKYLAWEVSGLTYAEFKKTITNGVKNCCVLTLEYTKSTKKWALVKMFENLIDSNALDDSG